MIIVEVDSKKNIEEEFKSALSLCYEEYIELLKIVAPSPIKTIPIEGGEK